MGVAPINVSYARNHLDSPARLAKLSFVYCPPLSCVVVVCLLLFVSPLVDSVALRSIGLSSQRAVSVRFPLLRLGIARRFWCGCVLVWSRLVLFLSLAFGYLVCPLSVSWAGGHRRLHCLDNVVSVLLCWLLLSPVLWSACMLVVC